mmetsp:Transcript_74987/g.139930  ORF Transcript_74987/g.139930 Transcript_74987/m.139930 type:complete len:407 (-) Transcript_74987:26-1246(-)
MEAMLRLQLWIYLLVCLSLGGVADSEKLPAEQPHSSGLSGEALYQDIQGLTRLEQAGKSQATHMLNFLQEKAKKKEQEGLTPPEMATAEQVRAILANHMMPTLLADAEDRQQEMDQLFEAIMECQIEVATEISDIQNLEKRIPWMEGNLTTCVGEESRIFIEKERVCEDFTMYRRTLTLPAEQPSSDAPPSEIMDYLEVMNEYFCGKWEVYEDKLNACRDLETNLTDTAEECVDKQLDFENTICAAKVQRMQTCSKYMDCFQAASTRYLDRKAEIEESTPSWVEQYEATAKALCLWDAWKLACAPCTIDGDRVRECYNMEPNTTAVEISLPPAPPSVDCAIDSTGPGGGEDYPCTPTFVQTHYASLLIEDSVLQRVKDSCSECFRSEAGARTTAQTTRPPAFLWLG